MTRQTASSQQSAEVVRKLERLLEREVQRLDSRRAEMGEVRDTIRALVREAPFAPLVHRADIEVVPSEVAPDVVGALFSEIGPAGIVRYVTRTVDVSQRLEDERIRDLRTRMPDGLIARAIYPLAILDTSAGRRWLEISAETGEQQRFAADPPSDFLIVGDSAVLAHSQWNDPDSDSVVLRDPMLIQAFIALYDTTYSMAVPLRAPGERGSDDGRLIDLMALGLKDEAIARTLGSSLRTVRRRIAALMDEHGVDTRFQLGAALHAQDRLTAGPPPTTRSPLRRTRRTWPRR